MKIIKIDTSLVFAHWRNWTFVQIYTDSGLVGLGEATLRSREHAVVSAIEEMSRVLIGQDPFQIQAHWQSLYRDFHNRGGPVLMTAISGIEIALWDVLGQELGVPIYQLFGGKLREHVWAYANGWFEEATSPDELAEKAKQAVGLGFTALKWNPFSGADGWMSAENISLAVERVRRVREAVGEQVELLIETHGLLYPAMALQMATRLAPYHPLFMEEPVPLEDIKAMASVHQRSPIPIAAGERLHTRFQFADLLEARAVDIIQPDVIHTGGFFEMRAIAAMAEARYVSFAPHNSSSPVGTAASLQMDACTPNFLIQELPVCDVPWRDEIVEPSTENIVEGNLILPSSAGLGVRLNERVVRKHPYQNPDQAALSPGATPDTERLAKKLTKRR